MAASNVGAIYFVINSIAFRSAPPIGYRYVSLSVVRFLWYALWLNGPRYIGRRGEKKEKSNRNVGSTD